MSRPPARPPARPVIPTMLEKRGRGGEKPEAVLSLSLDRDRRATGAISVHTPVAAAPASQAVASSQGAHTRTFVQRCPASSVACWCCHLPLAAAVLSCSVDANAQCRPPAVSPPCSAASVSCCRDGTSAAATDVRPRGRYACSGKCSFSWCAKRPRAPLGSRGEADVGTQCWGLFVAPFVRGATARGEALKIGSLSIPRREYASSFGVNVTATSQLFNGWTVQILPKHKTKENKNNKKRLMYEMSTMRPT